MELNCEKKWYSITINDNNNNNNNTNNHDNEHRDDFSDGILVELI